MSAQPVDSDQEQSDVAAFRRVPVVTPLGAAMRDRRISGQQLARVAGVHENSVYQWRAGKSLPQDALAHRVARALELPAAQLFPHLAVLAAAPAPVWPPEPPPAPQPSPPPVEARPVLLSARRLQPAQEQLDPQEFTSRLAQLMAARRIDVTRLAQASKVPVATLRGWLAGDPAAPDPKAASRLASALGTSADQLTGGTPTLLAVALEQRGWDYRRLARAIGATDKTVNAWVNGTRTPHYHAADAASAALGRSVEDLFDVARQPDPQPLPEPPAEGAVGDRDAGARGLPTVDQVLTVPATGRDDWAGDAACAQPGQDPDAWWPAPNDPAEQARATCGGCPVQGDCRDTYLASRDTPESRAAIWAGLPGGHLRVLARDRATGAAPQREPGDGRTVDAGIASAPRPPSASTTPALGQARRGGHLEPAPGADTRADARARLIRPAPAAPPAREPHAEPVPARTVAADSAQAAGDDAARATEQTAPRAAGAGPTRRPVGAAAGMAP